jgi:hypothetical protein
VTVYALKHPDGRFLYHLPTPDGFRSATDVTVFADGQPMEKLARGWWAAPAEAGVLSVTGKRPPKTVGYRLTDTSAESVRYPATLTLDDWEDRREYEGETLWTLYTSVQEEQPGLEHVYDGPVMVLEGREPPGPDEPQWVANLPHALTERPEYKHLFPGHIAGLVDHMKKIFEAMPRARYVLLNFQNRPGVYVDLRVPYDEPRTEWRADTSYRTGKKLKTGRTVPVLVSRSLTLPIADRVAADTYEEALALWDQQVAHWTRVVEEASVAACSHCDGKGYVPHRSEEHSR